MSVCLFFKDFLMWTIFKVFIEFVTASFLFYVLVFWPRDMWDLNSPTRSWTHMSCIGRHSLTHWTARDVPSRSGPRYRCFYLCVQVHFWVFLKPSVMMPQQLVSASSYHNHGGLWLLTAVFDSSELVKYNLGDIIQTRNFHLPTPLLHTWGCSVQFSSVAQSCPTLCDSMNRSMPGLPVHHQLPEFTQTHIHRVGDAIQPSHPLSSSFPPAPNPSQHQSLFQWVNSLHEVAKVLEFQL